MKSANTSSTNYKLLAYSTQSLTERAHEQPEFFHTLDSLLNVCASHIQEAGEAGGGVIVYINGHKHKLQHNGSHLFIYDNGKMVPIVQNPDLVNYSPNTLFNNSIGPNTVFITQETHHHLTQVERRNHEPLITYEANYDSPKKDLLQATEQSLIKLDTMIALGMIYGSDPTHKTIILADTISNRLIINLSILPGISANIHQSALISEMLTHPNAVYTPDTNTTFLDRTTSLDSQSYLDLHEQLIAIIKSDYHPKLTPDPSTIINYLSKLINIPRVNLLLNIHSSKSYTNRYNQGFTIRIEPSL